jgi:integrase
MGIRRPKLTRKALTSVSKGCVVDIAPGWRFSIESKNHGSIDFDFSSMAVDGRPELAAQLRDALWSLRFESEGVSLQSYFWALRSFWAFLVDLESDGTRITRLDQINRKCIDRYLAWLELQLVGTGHMNSGERLALSSKRNSYCGLKTLLINRKRMVPSEINEELDFPRNPFHKYNQTKLKREPYTRTEHNRILQALNTDLRAVHGNNAEMLPDLQVLTMYLLVLASSTGINLQPLLELKRDSLRPHPLEDRELLFTEKRRGWSSFAASVRKSAPLPEAKRDIHTVPSSIGDHFRALCKYTELIAQRAEPRLRDHVFLWSVSRGARKNEIVHLTRCEIKTGIRDFARRHRLLNDFGAPLALSFGRFRPTFANELYQRTRDIRKVSQALGHSSVETTARYYVGITGDSLRDHAIVAEGMVSAFTVLNAGGTRILAADGAIPSKEIKFLATKGYSTGIAHCRNPFRDDESLCKKFFTCFHCPNMLVMEDDLWRMFSFYYRLLAERTKLRPDHWLRTCGPIIRRIDEDIAPLFPVEKVNEAKLRARSDPHPTWRDPAL